MTASSHLGCTLVAGTAASHPPSRYNDAERSTSTSRRGSSGDGNGVGVDIYRKPRMVASNENSAASNEFVLSVGGKSTTVLRGEPERDERERDSGRTT